MAAVAEAATAHNKALQREAYQWYKGSGVCVRCKKAYAEPGRTLCGRCKRIDAAQKDRCDPGRVRRNAYSIERRARLKAAGLCVDCGTARAVEGKTRCPVCERKMKESRKRWDILQKIEREAQAARTRGRAPERISDGETGT